MATLFLAKLCGASGFTRHVAIKAIHPDLAADEQFRQMFLDEAMLSSRIQHPNVVHVEELGEHDGMHFLVMEFVHGCSLSQLQRALLARGRRLAPAFAARIAMHVADALQAAHETRDEHGRLLEVVHRDVTPENVLLSYSGHVKLIDFGIAKAYGRRHRTQDGLLKGKFRYMAPEQALGRAVDRRVDLYQLGIVLWEMLTLRRLFDAERDVDLLQSVQHPRVLPPSALVAGIPPALDSVVMAALAENAQQRPADAQTFARALAKAIPAAHDVDSGALRALLLAAMQEQRQRDRVSYPPGLYDRLDQQLDTIPLACAMRRDGAPVELLRHTLEHTSPYGSNTLQDERSTKPGSSRAASPLSTRFAAHELFRRRRPRQLVQFAEELRTALTRVGRDGFVGSRMFWLGIGAAVGLVGAVALIALGLHTDERVAKHSPPALPSVVASLQQASKRQEGQPQLPSDMRSSNAALVQVAGTGAARAAVADGGTRTRTPAVRSGKSPAREPVRAAGLVVIDDTPLVTEPGF